MAIAYPLSLLPFSIIYFLSDLLYFFLYDVAGFRKKIVFANLRNSFPEKTDAEIHSIAEKFYRNLCDILLECIKLLSIPKTEVSRRCVINNAELLDAYHRQGKSVIATIGHCGNWELAGLAVSLAVKHRCIAFYRTFRNAYFDRFAKKMRSRFGMQLLPHTKFRQMLVQDGIQPNLYIFITDQAPANTRKSYRTTFLNQDTAIYRGAEKTAKITGHPVVYGDMRRIKRGYYSIDVMLLTENPSQTKEGELTAMHTKALQNSIIRNPDNWLWTHRRWKRDKPAELRNFKPHDP